MCGSEELIHDARQVDLEDVIMTNEVSGSVNYQKAAMADFEVKECAYICGTPDADGDAPHFRVGRKSWVRDIPQEEWPEVTRITLQHDVNGEYCRRTRACVWVGEKIIFECPYQALTGVGYAL